MRAPAALRRLGYGLATVSGLARLGFFVPYRHAASMRPVDYAPLEPLFEAALSDFEKVLAAIERHGEALLALRGPAPAPRFDQGWFPRLDAAAAYALVRERAPARMVEVGCGHSTRFLARAIADGGLATALTCIDPAPRARLEGLAIEHVASTVQEAPSAPFEGLGAGDVLFVDSSHVLVPGSDVDVLLNRVLPRLPAGVLVHVHDILLPDPYPEAWAWRGYNEQSAVACLLQGGGYALRFASHWLASRHGERLRRSVLARLPHHAGAPETSLWLEKRA